MRGRVVSRLFMSPNLAASLSPDERLGLPEDLREEEIRRFWTKESTGAIDDDLASDVWDSRGG